MHVMYTNKKFQLQIGSYWGHWYCPNCIWYRKKEFCHLTDNQQSQTRISFAFLLGYDLKSKYFLVHSLLGIFPSGNSRIPFGALLSHCDINFRFFIESKTGKLIDSLWIKILSFCSYIGPDSEELANKQLF